MGRASGCGPSGHHVWSYDFVADRTHDGRPFRILNILDEYTRECLASVVARRIRSQDVLVDPGRSVPESRDSRRIFGRTMGRSSSRASSDNG